VQGLRARAVSVADKPKYNQARRNELAQAKGFKNYAAYRNSQAKAKGFKSSSDETKKLRKKREWRKWFAEKAKEYVVLGGLEAVDFETLLDSDMNEFWELFRSEYAKLAD
jgi:hypothetical protein